MPSNPIDELTEIFEGINNRLSASDANFTLPEGESGGALFYLDAKFSNLSSEVDTKLNAFKTDTLDATLTTFKTENLDPIQDTIDLLNGRLDVTEPNLQKFIDSWDKIELIDVTYSAVSGASQNITSVASWLIDKGIAPAGTTINDILSYNQ